MSTNVRGVGGRFKESHRHRFQFRVRYRPVFNRYLPSSLSGPRTAVSPSVSARSPWKIDSLTPAEVPAALLDIGALPGVAFELTVAASPFRFFGGARFGIVTPGGCDPEVVLAIEDTVLSGAERERGGAFSYAWLHRGPPRHHAPP
jgi:hypothetical protein